MSARVESQTALGLEVARLKADWAAERSALTDQIASLNASMAAARDEWERAHLRALKERDGQHQSEMMEMSRAWKARFQREKDKVAQVRPRHSALCLPSPRPRVSQDARM